MKVRFVARHDGVVVEGRWQTVNSECLETIKEGVKVMVSGQGTYAEIPMEDGSFVYLGKEALTRSAFTVEVKKGA